MNDWIIFLQWQDPNARTVTIGTMLIGIAAAVVGSFAFLRKRALVGDAIAHAILPGVALAFMLTHSKAPLVLMSGALVFGLLAMAAIEYIAGKSKIKPDTSIALVLSVFFGLGILLLTTVQHSGAGNQAGLDQFLLGRAAGMQASELRAYAGVAVLILVVVLLGYKEFKLVSFNPEFARAAGLPVRGLQNTLSVLTVMTIATGIQAVGVVLMAALLITPPAAARVWTHRLGAMLVLAAGIGAVSGWLGTSVSFAATQMPTGPWIVMSLSTLALLSLFLAPGRGVLARLWQQRQNRQKIRNENILKSLYHLSERRGTSSATAFSQKDIRQLRAFYPAQLEKGLRKLRQRFYVLKVREGWRLTDTGREEARRVVRLHRLWEMYLTERLRLKADHIHPNAETIEHIITPEIERQLLHELDYPEKDPHESPIPYDKKGDAGF